MTDRPIDFRKPAFVHERWADLPDCHLIAVCRDGFAAEIIARALAGRADDKQPYVVTDTSYGSQAVWTKARVEAGEATNRDGAS